MSWRTEATVVLAGANAAISAELHRTSQTLDLGIGEAIGDSHVSPWRITETIPSDPDSPLRSGVMKRTLAVLATALLLAGCAGTTGSKDDDPPVGSNAQATKAADETSDEAAEPDSNLTFGETYTYEDGLSITIGKPKKFTPSEYSAYDESAAQHLAFEVVVVNGTEANFDPAGVYITLQSGDAEADQVFDSENGFDGGPTTKLLPGRQAKFKVGFSVNAPEDLVMEVSPGAFEYQSVIFTR